MNTQSMAGKSGAAANSKAWEAVADSTRMSKPIPTETPRGILVTSCAYFVYQLHKALGFPHNRTKSGELVLLPPNEQASIMNESPERLITPPFSASRRLCCCYCTSIACQHDHDQGPRTFTTSRTNDARTEIMHITTGQQSKGHAKWCTTRRIKRLYRTPQARRVW